jgi:hypothetical protein
VNPSDFIVVDRLRSMPSETEMFAFEEKLHRDAVQCVAFDLGVKVSDGRLDAMRAEVKQATCRKGEGR